MIVSIGLVVAISVTISLIVAAERLPTAAVAWSDVQAIRADGGEPFALRAFDLAEEPDVVGRWAELEDFYERQGEIIGRLRASAVQVRVDGEWRRASVGRRHLRDLPAAFWALLASSLLACIVGLFTYAFSDRGPPARIYVFSAVAFATAVWPAALYSTRPIALEPDVFRWLSTIDHVGALFFASGVIAILAIYPVRLVRWVSWLWIYAGVAGVAGHLQWGPMWLSGFYTANFGHFVLFIVFSIWQWRASRKDPLQRAALGWMLLSMWIGVILFATLITVPILAGTGPAITQTTGLVTITLMYAGISLGVLRFRLFELDRWWFRTWSWILGGAAVVGVDLILTRVFAVTQSVALVLALILAGWVYFPIRQKLFERLARTGKTAAVDASSLVAAATLAELRPRFRGVLRATFAPLEIVDVDERIPSPRLASDGEWLEVPAPAGEGGFRCRLRDGGTRLYSLEDVVRAAELVALGESVRVAITARQDGELAERARIRRDLHDDLGASIIRIAHEAPDDRIADLAKGAMRDLRDVLTALHDAPTACREVLDDLEADLRVRAQADGRDIEWSVDGETDRVLSARARANLTRALRESMTNALRHGAGSVRYAFALDPRELRARVSNPVRNGSPLEPGLGLGNIESRMGELGGTATWARADGAFTLDLRLPWSAES